MLLIEAGVGAIRFKKMEKDRLAAKGHKGVTPYAGFIVWGKKMLLRMLAKTFEFISRVCK